MAPATRNNSSNSHADTTSSPKRGADAEAADRPAKHIKHQDQQLVGDEAQQSVAVQDAIVDTSTNGINNDEATSRQSAVMTSKRSEGGDLKSDDEDESAEPSKAEEKGKCTGVKGQYITHLHSTRTYLRWHNGIPGTKGTGSKTVSTNEKKTEVIELNNFAYIPSKVLERLRRMATYSFPAGFRYRLVDVEPARLSWGGFRSQYLSWRGLDLRVLFLARLRKKRMVDDETNEPIHSARIWFKFLWEKDWVMARRLIRERASPPSGSAKRTFQASCPTSISHGKGVPKEPYTFNEIYNGTKVFGPKSKMAKINQNALESNDVILVEARIQRWGAEMPKWSEGWDTGFYLESITKLYDAPPTAEDEPESAMEDERIPTDDELEM